MSELTTEVAAKTTKANSRRFFIVQILIAVLVIGAIALMALRLAKVTGGQRDSGMAPDFALVSFDDETVTLSELRGQVVIINFWASWCPPCREEAPYLESTWRKYQDQGVVFIGVDYIDTEKKALAYLREFDISYLNGPDIGTRISQAYRIDGVPETYYIAKNGEIRGVKIGPLAAPELNQKIDELLEEPYPE
ncbi:MAG TPA: TlpA disulfide reductase family protein [candidate division Zixibacteria bacterium]|nr:TlpA disulfide reductase family protein [candidate division Zixibacteria bacterium]